MPRVTSVGKSNFALTYPILAHALIIVRPLSLAPISISLNYLYSDVLGVRRIERGAAA